MRMREETEKEEKEEKQPCGTTPHYSPAQPSPAQHGGYAYLSDMLVGKPMQPNVKNG